MEQIKLPKYIRALNWKSSIGCCVLFLALLFVPPAMAENSDETSGGVYLILAPNLGEAHKVHFDILWPKVRNALAAERGIVGSIRREQRLNGNLYVQISEPEGARYAWEIVDALLASETELYGLSGAKFDVKMEGLLLTIAFDDETARQINNQIIAQTIETVRARLAKFGFLSAQVMPFETEFIQLLAMDIAATEIFILLESPANLVVNQVIARTVDPQQYIGAGRELLPDMHDKSTYFIVENHDLLTNQNFTEFESAFDLNGNPAINFRLNEVGTQSLDVHIKNEPNGLIAFVLDGEVISVAMNNRVRIPSNEGTIHGKFTLGEANRIATLLNIGNLPVSLDVVQYREISPPLSISR